MSDDTMMQDGTAPAGDDTEEATATPATEETETM